MLWWPMNFSEFEITFRGSGVRSWISWDILSGLDCEIEEIYTSSASVLSGFYTVWYISPDGKNGDWRNPQDRPLTIGEALDVAAAVVRGHT